MKKSTKILTILALTSAFTIIASPSNAEELVEKTVPEIVEYGPPDPTLDENCDPVDPNPNDLWSYVGEPDPPAGEFIWVDAFLPEGYQIGVTGQRYWSSVWNGWELTCPVPVEEPEPEPVTEPVPVVPAPPADEVVPPPTAPVEPVVVEQPVVTETLAETGVEEDLLIWALILTPIGLALVLYHRIRTGRHSSNK